MDTNDLKLNFPHEWGSLLCPKCQSPFHEAEQCSTGRDEEFKFKTRKELGLKNKDIPFKFQVEEVTPLDDEVEISRKRSLLRINTSKVYNLLGFSIKAQESQKAALQWIIRLADELDIEDDDLQEERNTLLPLIKTLQDVNQQLTQIRQTKVSQAVKMEELATNARRKAQRVRTRITKKKDVDKEFWVLKLPDSGVSVPILYDENVDPVSVFKQAAEAILEKERGEESWDEESNKD